MKRPPFSRSIRSAGPATGLATGLATLLLSTVVLLLHPGCTDLNENPFSAVTSENFYQSEADYFTGLAGVYAQTRSVMWNYFNLSEVSSDEAIVPTRGTDWADGGRWIAMHRHSWDANLTDLNGAWNDAFTGVARANELLKALESATFGGKDQIAAEARFLRAYFYYQLMDFFGGVPVVTEADIPVDQTDPPAASSRQEVFAFIEQELLSVREQLPSRFNATDYGRATQGAADALLASLYVNAEVFTGTVTASGLQRGTPMWEQAIQAADRILNSGQYQLAADWFSNFTPDNHNSPELIYVIGNVAQPDLGNTLPMRTLHYGQLEEGPWNGFATLAETYNAFDQDDLREGMWLAGPASSFEDGSPVNIRNSSERLVFSPQIADISSATEAEGVRFNKYYPDLENSGGQHGNDFVIFRLAEIYLIKAEALNELGRTAEAVALVNFIRERAFDPDKPITAADQASVREAILHERLYELAFEGKRRQDLIRSGKFAEQWSHKSNTDPYRVLFPIPQLQLGANPKLMQNPGY